MKKLVIYFSQEGNTKHIAEAIGDELKSDILELKPKKIINEKSMLKFIWYGKQVLFKEKPELEPIKIDIPSYDFIIIGSPVWVGGFTPAYNTFLKYNKFEHKRVALFCCHEGNKGQIFEKLRKEMPNAYVVGEMDFRKPANNLEDHALKARKWIKEVVDRINIFKF